MKKFNELPTYQKVLSIVLILAIFIVLMSLSSSSSTKDEISNQETINAVVNIQDYLNKSMNDLASQLGVSKNQAGNIIYENSDYHMLIESKNGETSTYVQVDIKSMPNCKADNTIINKADEAFLKVGLNNDATGMAKNQAGINIGSAQFCDYGNKEYSLGLSCDYTGGNYSVSLSNDRTSCN